MILNTTITKIFTVAFLTAGLILTGTAQGQDSNNAPLLKLPEIERHGFLETRAGYRTGNDKYEKDMSIMESRLRLDFYSYLDWGDVTVKGDVFGDMVTEEADGQLREANIFLRPYNFMDVKVGRQILTWGTGDLIFINDLFPKDWESFFIGRDNEYLKAPSDAVKASLFSDRANLDIVYTPQFDPDRYIDGRRISYWNSQMDSLAGNNAVIHTDRPDQWFHDDEITARLYKNINNYEAALYGYHGFWKSPAGLNNNMTKAIFPALNVYGASIRGTLGKGIGNMEIGYYDSEDDTSGRNPLINNSEMRYLAGYTQEIGKDLTMGLQYYVEQLLDYDAYTNSLDSGDARDEYRHLTTLRLTKLLMDQNLRLSLFIYYSPSDQDTYFRSNIHYKINDNLSVETGANIFYGDEPHTFFGQFEDNSNIYVGLRYSF